MEPIANDLKEMPGSWAIPVGILIVLSFPPLFGHEIVGVLCGVIWPLWTAFGIVSLGTLLGELANFFVFKYACTKRAQKYEREDVRFSPVSARDVRSVLNMPPPTTHTGHLRLHGQSHSRRWLLGPFSLLLLRKVKTDRAL